MADSNVIPGFKKLSKQRIFNMAVAHIGKTRQQSKVDGSCVYGGSGCAASPLLTEQGREGGDHVGDWDCLIETGFVPTNNAVFIKELQNAHDYVSCGTAFMPNWIERMRQLAERWNLSTSTLDKVPA
jgi:hypothetical protein